METPKKIMAVEGLQLALSPKREDGEIVVLCHGCFDIVHPGHVRYLRYARSLGDILVVSITSDAQIGKGYDRPYIHQDLRAESLAAFEFVDFVCIDANETAAQIIERLAPDIYVKGKEYELSTDPRFVAERNAVESYGGKVFFSSGDVVFSSTRLLERVRAELPMDAERIRVFCKAHGIGLSQLESTLDAFPGANVVIVGDPILDRYVNCEDSRIASESPVISVTPVESEEFVGGAGLIARQLAALGASTTLATTLDSSDASRRFRDELEGDGVNVRAISTSSRPMFVKTRYLVEGQKVFKVNEGQRSPLPQDLVAEMDKQVQSLLRDADMLVVTDFGYGLFGADLVARLIAAAEASNVPYAVDVSHAGSTNLLSFVGPRLATPTEDELRLALGDLDGGLSTLAARYFKQTGSGSLYLTLGRKGVVHFAPPTDTGARLAATYLPAFNRHPIDTVGAGDAFLSSAVLAAVVGAPDTIGMYLGSALAALHTSSLGNAPTRVQELREYLSHRPELKPQSAS